MKSNSVSTADIQRLLLSHNIFVAGRFLFEIFLNLFIWKETQDLTLIAYFNLVYLAVHMVTFHSAAGIIKEGRIHVPRISALLGFALIYLLIFVLQENVLNHLIPLAVGIGFFNGLYWISYQVSRFDLTTRTNRGNYSGIEIGTKTIVGILMPLFGGAIIAANIFGFGYSNLFLVGSLFFLVSLIIGNVRLPVHTLDRLHVRKTLALLWKNPDMRKSMYGAFFGQFSRGGTIVRLVLPFIIFEATRSELQLGVWLSFFSVIAIVASFIFGKFVHYKHYKAWMFLAGVIYALLIVFVAFFPSFWAYVVFGSIVQILTVAIFIPKRTISENLIHSFEDENNHRVEYVVIREWFNIGFGRMASFLVLLTVDGLADSQMKFLLLLMAFAVFAEVSFFRSIKGKV